MTIFAEAQAWIEKAQTGVEDFFGGCLLWSKLHGIAVERDRKTLEYTYDAPTREMAKRLAAWVDAYLDFM